MINIFYTNISEDFHKSLLEVYLPKFSSVYQARIRRYRRWQDAQVSLLGRILLFQSVKELYDRDYTDKDIKYSKYNKPYFSDTSIKFNISHSGEMVICALSDESEIGIDLELISNIPIDEFKSELTEEEWSKITIANNIQDAFFDFWTQKEAVVKAHGMGLAIPLKSFEIFDNVAKIDNESFYLKEIKIDEKYKCYISLLNDSTDICLTHKRIDPLTI
ncbi:4'-phosphopantetheinyl transferase family protein [Flavobacterium sp. N502540]|uniref:4'-phosphopantetheinyl transferase family protein n=1 Tax=Flavobacterium sp. N502540 TaxID=2986838 RepID=UPI002223FAB0|nr:4'-phosphopantetheinyl transferase superfamily protein [Flavobacterium sp. N502540]